MDKEMIDKQTMDKRSAEILEMYEKNALGLDDTFQFKCKECGKCCKNREDILLTTRDLYNIARELGRLPEEIIARYCEVYIGSGSRMPLVRLRPVPPENSCPLLYKKKCIVHKAKPSVCALFPLGRGTSLENMDESSMTPDSFRPTYFVQPIKCGTTDRSQTVREWLEKFGLPIEDEFYGPWNDIVAFLSSFFREIEKRNLSSETMDLVWGGTMQALYIDYDPKAELIPQFLENIAKLKDVVNTSKDMIKQVFGEAGISDGE